MFDKIIDIVAKPIENIIEDTSDVLEGLSECEIRTKAISRLGATAIVGLTTAEIIDLLSGLDDR
jgi:hypothetical protein